MEKILYLQYKYYKGWYNITTTYLCKKVAGLLRGLLDINISMIDFIVMFVDLLF